MLIKPEDVFKYHDQMCKTILQNNFYVKEFNDVKKRYSQMLGDLHMNHRDVACFWIDFWWKIPEDAVNKDPYTLIKDLAEAKYIPMNEYLKSTE